jgi:hypothetical protein
MNEDLFEELRQSLERAEQSAGLIVSDPAKELISNVISAIGTDAVTRPFDEPPPASVDDCQRRAIAAIPSILRIVYRRHPVKKIGVFHLLDCAPQISGMFFIFKYGPP